MHRRQGDLLEMHPCVTRTFQSFQTFETFQTLVSSLVGLNEEGDTGVDEEIKEIAGRSSISTAHRLEKSMDTMEMKSQMEMAQPLRTWMLWPMWLSGYHADTPITNKAKAIHEADSRIHSYS